MTHKVRRNLIVAKGTQWLLRLALATAFLSAVADRFGIWGPPGAPGVAWGDWNTFLDYVAILNQFAPVSFIPVMGWVATIAEVGLAFGLIIGWQLKWFALASGLLLTAFALMMTIALGIKVPIDYSVFTASAGAFLLAAANYIEPLEAEAKINK
ncbi:MAG: DoxX family protein [candidate division Zixibacteria bacterium]|nr:DoxX family protein [candidate division Zixibacteria bacterium]